MSYKQVIEEIIQKEKEIIGEVAVAQANSLDFLEFKDGKVTAKKELGKEDVEKVVDKYRDISGKGAIGVAREAIKELDKEKVKRLNLPQEILPEEIKLEEFGEAF